MIDGESMINATSGATGIIAYRKLGFAVEIANKLKSLDYIVSIELHCKFWLVHWQFPTARKLAGTV